MVELTNSAEFVNPTNISTKIETAMLSKRIEHKIKPDPDHTDALATLTTLLITLNILTDQKIDQEDKYILITLPCCIEGPYLV